MNLCSKKKKSLKLLFIVGIICATLILAILYLNQEPIRSSYRKPNQKVLLFSHRGYDFFLPENSYASVKAVQDNGFKAVEIDINNTKDNKLVLFHDKDLKRMLGREGEINNYNLLELQKHNLLWQKKETDQRIIELETLFKDFPNLIYYLDLKNPSIKNLNILYSLIEKYKMEDKVIVAHAKLLPHFYSKLKHPKIANALEGFNSGKEKLIKYIPKRLRPNFYSSFFHKISEKQIEFYNNNNMIDNIIVYDINGDNYEKAINKFGLRNLIIDIEN